MPGVVAAGSRHTAEAAASTLRAGGNAVDAAIAGAAACFSAEPLLASAGGAGIMIVREAGRAPVAVDFFSAAPSGPIHTDGANALDFEAITVDFGSAVQTFHVGRGSAAVPTMFDGLAVAARRFGSRPLAESLAPAIALARDGLILDRLTARTFELLWPILRRDPACLAEIAHGLASDRPPRPGERLRNPKLAATLEAFAEAGGTPPAVADGLLAHFGEDRGGRITAADLRPRVDVCPAHGFELGGWRVATSPRLGGVLVGVIAQGLDEAGSVSGIERVRRHAQASLAGHRARLEVPPGGHRGSTTHVSVVDERGGAASVTLTSGEGCGHVVPGTGVHVNNFLGEEDLNPAGFHRHAAGAALPTMIAPTIAVHDDGRVLALGSGGANRIRSAVASVLHAIAVEEASLESAVAAPRLHGEDDAVWIELAGRVDGSEVDELCDALAESFANVHPFPDRDFFFGGVHVAHRSGDGHLAGVGDPRRGGVAIRVD